MTASEGAPTDRLRARHRHTPTSLTASPDAGSGERTAGSRSARVSYTIGRFLGRLPVLRPRKAPSE